MKIMIYYRTWCIYKITSTMCNQSTYPATAVRQSLCCCILFPGHVAVCLSRYITWKMCSQIADTCYFIHILKCSVYHNAKQWLAMATSVQYVFTNKVRKDTELMFYKVMAMLILPYGCKLWRTAKKLKRFLTIEIK